MDRNPPISVREQLRKEVHFGCPVSNCGSPYLQYHHFDPSWSEKHHHNPDGMIALCLEHHAQADGGAWTKEQLRHMKEFPYIPSEVRGGFNWQRQDVALIVGGEVFKNPKVILRIYGENVLWMEKSVDGDYRLNMIVRDVHGNLVVKIVNNDWLVYNRKVIDINSPPSGKMLTVISRDLGNWLSVRFDDLKLVDFAKKLDSLAKEMAKEMVKAEKESRAQREKGFQEGLARIRWILDQQPKMSEEQKRYHLEEHIRRHESWNRKMELEAHATLNDDFRETSVANTLKSFSGIEKITTCTINGSLTYRDQRIQLREGILSINNVHFIGCSASNYEVVYNIM
jgi:hypothetical protein